MDGSLAEELEDVAAMIALLSDGLEGAQALAVDSVVELDSVDNLECESQDGSSEDHTNLVDSLETAARECAALIDLLGVNSDKDKSPRESCDEDECESDGKLSLFDEDANDPISDAESNGVLASDACTGVEESLLFEELNEFAGELVALSSAMTELGAPLASADNQMAHEVASKEHPSLCEDDDVNLAHSISDAVGEFIVPSQNVTLADISESQSQVPQQLRQTISKASTSTETISQTVMEEATNILSKGRSTGNVRHSRGSSVIVCRAHRRSLSFRHQLRKKDPTVLNSHSVRARKSSSSDTLTNYWSEFQHKSFTRHISRQQIARLRERQAQAAQQRLVEERYRQSATLHNARKHLKYKTEKQSLLRAPAPAVHNRSYLVQFQSRHEGCCSNDPGETERQDFHKEGERLRLEELSRVLCAIYKFSHRRDSLVYMTFASMAQLRERITSRLGVSRIVNIYREKCSSPTSRGGAASIKSKSYLLQRISGFDEIQDGDTLCVTQDAYEDMAILCEWMVQRRQQTAPASIETPKPSSIKFNRSSKGPIPSFRGNAIPALRRMVEGDAIRNNRRAAPPIWDANGRSIRAGDASYRVDCNNVAQKQSMKKQ